MPQQTHEDLKSADPPRRIGEGLTMITVMGTNTQSRMDGSRYKSCLPRQLSSTHWRLATHAALTPIFPAFSGVQRPNTSPRHDLTGARRRASEAAIADDNTVISEINRPLFARCVPFIHLHHLEADSMRSLTPTGLYIADYTSLGSSSKVTGVAIDPETAVGYVALERIEEGEVEVDVLLMDQRNPSDFPEVSLP